MKIIILLQNGEVCYGTLPDKFPESSVNELCVHGEDTHVGKEKRLA